MESSEGTVTERGKASRNGVTVSEAAERLGVSQRAIRARIARKTVSAWKVQGERGPEWRVDPASLEVGTEAALPEGTVTVQAVSGWEAERAALLDQVAWLRGQVEDGNRDRASLVETLAEQARALEAAQHNVRALEAKLIRALPVPDVPAEPEPVDIQGSMPTETYETGKPMEYPTPAPRPWWKFWG